MVYIFQKNPLQKGEGWTQHTMFQFDYTPYACYFLARDVIMVADFDYAILYFYEYNADNGTVRTLQDPILIKKDTVANAEGIISELAGFFDPDSSFEEFNMVLEDLFASDFSDIITDIAVSSSGVDDYFAFTTSTSKISETGWTEKGVSVYKRQARVMHFVLAQYINSSDYHGVGFGREIAIDRDLMVISGLNQSHIFSQQRDGYFEVTLVFDEQYDYIRLSGRNLLLSNIPQSEEEENEVLALNLEMCTQPISTQMPTQGVTHP
mmetsp:Transcript_36050/g.61489  ORF Transcript_36050/g.61489 Transcript_36050/m.61489 type:complete len:265 (+) Transcript_36050:1917-2711(+)